VCPEKEKTESAISLRYSAETLLLTAGWLDTEVLCNDSWQRNYLMYFGAFDISKGRNVLAPSMEPSGNGDSEMQSGDLC